MARRLRNRGFDKLEIYSPAAFPELDDALDEKPSGVRAWTLVGGLLGVTTGYAVTIWMSLNWPIVIGGKPFASVAPYTIIGFELTILFGGLATLLGLLVVGKLPYGKLRQERQGLQPALLGRGVRPRASSAPSATWRRSTRCCARTTRWRSTLSRRELRARWLALLVRARLHGCCRAAGSSGPRAGSRR